MATENSAEKKSSWTPYVFNVVAGLLLAGLGYVFSQIFTYAIAEKGDIYLVERPDVGAGRIQRILVIDNFSSNAIGELQLTVAAENISTGSAINIERIDAVPIGPRSSLLKVVNVLPNRQASFSIEASTAIRDDNLRMVKSPIGFQLRPKDRLLDGFWDWSALFTAVVNFLMYVGVTSYFQKRLADLKEQANKIEAEISERKKQYEERWTDLDTLKKATVQTKLLYVRKILELRKENRLWREICIGYLESFMKDERAAKKLLGILLKKAGVTPSRSLDDVEDDELVEIIENGNTTPKLSSR